MSGPLPSEIRCPECGYVAEYIGENDKLGLVEYRCICRAKHKIGRVFFVEREQATKRRVKDARRLRKP